MIPLTPLLIILALLVFVIVLKLMSQSGRSVGLPYVASGPLFTLAERSFLGVLDSALGRDYRVFGKVRIADVAKVKTGLSRSARQGALNRVAQKHFDYVVCRASDLVVVCAVELDDKSHSNKKAQARDDLVAGVCRVIGLPLMRVVATRAYSEQEVLDQFEIALKPVEVG